MWKRIPVDNIITSAIILLVINFVPWFFQGDFLDPVQNLLQDMKVTDIYFSHLQDKEKIPVDTNIVLVNAGLLDRNGIAEQVEILNDCKPKAIGIDIFFRHDKGDIEDKKLETAFSKAKNLVLVSRLINYDVNSEVFNDAEHSLYKFSRFAKSGFANFTLEDTKGDTLSRTTRKFSPVERIKNYYELSFPVKLAHLADTNKTQNFLNRANPTEIINFKRNMNKYYILDVYDLQNGNFDTARIRNKIVIIGFMGIDTKRPYSWDTFFTPMNTQYIGKSFPDMYGSVIHANILSMLMEEDYINSLSSNMSIFLTILMIYMTMAIFRYFRYNWAELYETIGLFILIAMLLIYLVASVYTLKIFKFSAELNSMFFILILAEIVFESYHGSIKPLAISAYHSRKAKNERSFKNAKIKIDE